LKIQAKIQSLNSQLEVLAERLGQLPKSVSPEPVFKQMQKLEEVKILETTKLQAEQRGGAEDLPAALKDYTALTSKLALLADSPEAKHAILTALIERVEVTAEGFKIHYFVGREKIKRELAKTSSRLNSNPELLDSGSNSLTNGAGDWTGRFGSCLRVVVRKSAIMASAFYKFAFGKRS
jgi:DNA-binding Lrp family transcriptional regulator